MNIDYSDIYKSLNTLCEEAGTTLTEVCRQAKVDRSTVERWKVKSPKTLVIIGEMIKVIEKSKPKNVKSSSKTLPGMKGLTRRG